MRVLCVVHVLRTTDNNISGWIRRHLKDCMYNVCQAYDVAFKSVSSVMRTSASSAYQSYVAVVLVSFYE